MCLTPVPPLCVLSVVVDGKLKAPCIAAGQWCTSSEVKGAAFQWDDGFCYFPQINVRDMLLEELMSMGMLLTQSNTPVSPPELQIIEPVQEIREIPAQGPRQSSFHDSGQSQTFLDIGKAISYPSCSLFLFESSSSLMVLVQVGVISSLNIIDMVKCPPKLPSLCILQP